MSFTYVDKITALCHGASIEGIKNVTSQESFFYKLPTGAIVPSPAVVTEALAQLGAWLQMASTDFTKRPVLLSDEHTFYEGWACPGDVIQLIVDEFTLEDDVVSSRCQAFIDGKRILLSHRSRGYLLPMEEFDDRNRVLAQFKQLYRPPADQSSPTQPPLQRRGEFSCLSLAQNQHLIDGFRFIDGVLDFEKGKKVRAFKNFARCESFFPEHFPRRAVVPGVLLMTLIGEGAQLLLHDAPEQFNPQRVLIPLGIKDVRFRKFVEPGDQCVLDLDLVEGRLEDDASDVLVRATLWVQSQRVLQAHMMLRTMDGTQSQALKRAPFDRFLRI